MTSFADTSNEVGIGPEVGLPIERSQFLGKLLSQSARGDSFKVVDELAQLHLRLGFKEDVDVV